MLISLDHSFGQHSTTQASSTEYAVHEYRHVSGASISSRPCPCPHIDHMSIVHAGSSLDSYLTTPSNFMSGQTFLSKVVPQLGSRAWGIAFHPYPPNLLLPQFSADDWPLVTFGTHNTPVCNKDVATEMKTNKES